MPPTAAAAAATEATAAATLTAAAATAEAIITTTAATAAAKSPPVKKKRQRPAGTGTMTGGGAFLLALYVLLPTLPTLVQAAFKPTSAGYSVDRTYRSNGGNATKVPVVKAFIEGGVIFGGLFPVHHTTGNAQQRCSGLQHDRGIERLEAMLFTIDEINRNKTLLPGIKLGANIFDTCGMSTYALEQSLEFIRGSFTSLDTTEFICSDGSTAVPRNSGTSVAGVIGGSYSSVSIQVANLLRLFKLPQISYASTSASLSDKSRYDYFVRTVPPDVLQAKALADIVVEFNWTYVSTVQSEGEYGKSGMDYFKQEARAKNICIAASVEIPEKANSKMYDDAIKEVMEKNDARVVIVFVRTEDAVGLLDAATRKNSSSRFVFVASDAWGNRIAPVQHNQNVAQGAITLELQSKPVPEFEKYFLGLNPRSNVRNPWYKEYWEEVHKCRWDKKAATSAANSDATQICSGDEKVNRKLENQESKVQFIYDAVYALALALHNMQADICGRHYKGVCPDLKTIDGERLLKDYLLNISFNDGYGAKVQFDEKGDAPGRYTIMNYQRNRRTREHEYKVVGNWSDGQLDIDLDSIVWAGGTMDIPRSRCSEPCNEGEIKRMQKDKNCCWICTKCSPWEYIKDEKTCEKCEKGSWPFVNKTGCFPLEVQHMRWGSIYAIMPMVLAGLGICGTMFVILLFVMFNSTPVVMASGRELSYMLLSGCVLCYFMTFVLLSTPSPFMCAAQRFGVGFGFSIVYSSLLIKTNRISRIFESARRSAKRPPFISPKSQIVMTCVLIVMQVLFTSVWLLVEPPGTKLHYPDEREPVVILRCSSEDISFLVSLVYNILLIVICTIYAVKTRKIPENFNESKFIGFAMYTTCIIWLAFVPIYFGTLNSFRIQITTLCVSISLSATVALLCLFMPKVYIIVFQPQKNVRKLTMNSASYKQAPSGSNANSNNYAPSSEHIRLNVQQRVIAGNAAETETDRDSLASL